MRRSIEEEAQEILNGEPADIIPPPAGKPQRDRTWERQKRRQVGQVTYRGVPPETNERVKSAAGQLGVRVGEMARALLEYALDAWDRGEIDLETHPRDGVVPRTLYPPVGED